MQKLRWIIIGLALIEAGWMTFDGARALIVGDYVTPQSGEYAGQLGPWTKIVSAVGLEPRSTLMKCTFVLYGAGWLVIILEFARKRNWARWGMLIASVGSLWYLWVGTVSSAILVALLLLMRRNLVEEKQSDELEF